MRVLASILIGSVVSIATYSALWSGFVVQQHSYGGDSALSQFGGTLAYFGIYLFPVLLVFSMGVMFAGEALLTKRKIRARGRWRWLAWTMLSLVVLGGITSLSTPALWMSAVICGTIAGAAGAFMYAIIPKKEEANQSPQTTRAFGPRV